MTEFGNEPRIDLLAILQEGAIDTHDLRFDPVLALDLRSEGLIKIDARSATVRLTQKGSEALQSYKWLPDSRCAALKSEVLLPESPVL